MVPAISRQRIAELLSPFLDEAELADAQLQQVSIYLDLLMRWNKKINLTAVRDPEEIITRHFGESFFAARHLVTAALHEPSPTELLRVPRSSSPLGEVGSNAEDWFIAGTAIDVGSGAGFPGLPIKIFNSEIDLTLVESSYKKAAFLGEVVRALSLVGATVWPKRAEHLNCAADLVTLRAVEQFETILPIAARLVATKGRLVLLIGASQLEAAESGLAGYRSRIETTGSQIGKIAWAEPSPIPLSRNRILAIANFS